MPKTVRQNGPRVWYITADYMDKDRDFANFFTILCCILYLCNAWCTGWSKKPDTQFYFWDNFGNPAPISTILSVLQAEIYGA